jgi:hypothetical protein
LPAIRRTHSCPHRKHLHIMLGGIAISIGMLAYFFRPVCSAAIDQRRTAAQKRVVHEFAEPPMMNFGDAESQIVEFSPGLPYHGAFFFLTYQHGSCWNQ